MGKFFFRVEIIFPILSSQIQGGRHVFIIGKKNLPHITRSTVYLHTHMIMIVDFYVFQN